MKTKNSLITGSTKGLGLSFARHFLDDGYAVYGCGRTKGAIEHSCYHHAILDLEQLSEIKEKLKTLLCGVEQVDTVILNAGVLGGIKSMSDFSQLEINSLMSVNVWANKVILDTLLNDFSVREVIMVSSGAAVRGNKGWGAYSLSKATLNMLCQLYAAEYQGTHFISLAPGLVDTDMQSYLCDQDQVDEQQFPSVKRLRSARGTSDMPTPAEAATLILNALPRTMQDFQSGEFVDIRQLIQK